MIKDIQSLTTKQIDLVFASLKLSGEDKLNLIKKYLGNQVEIEYPTLVNVWYETEQTTEYFKIKEDVDFNELFTSGMHTENCITESQFLRDQRSGLKVQYFKFADNQLTSLETIISEVNWEDALYEEMERLLDETRSDVQGIYEAFQMTATASDKEMVKQMTPKLAATFLVTRS